MEYLAIAVSFGCLLAYLSVRRGRTTVRAAMYLMYLEKGTSVEDANNAAGSASYAEAAKHQSGIIRYATKPFAGSQLRMTEMARRQGFKG